MCPKRTQRTGQNGRAADGTRHFLFQVRAMRTCRLCCVFGEKGRFGAGVSNRLPRMEKAKLSTEGQAQEARTPSCNHTHLSALSHPLMLLWSPGENTTKGPSEAALFSSPPRHTASPNPRQRKLCELKVCRCKGNGGPGWIERPGDAKKEKKKAKKKKKKRQGAPAERNLGQLFPESTENRR